MLNKILNIVDCVLNDIVWNWIYTFGIMYGQMFVCVWSIDVYVVREIFELH